MTQTRLQEHLLYIYQLKNIIRYNSRKRLVNESVAEHSFFVALIALEICIEKELDEATTLKCIIKALLHDMPEIEINDITYNVKEKLNLREMLKTYEDNFYKEKYEKYYELMSNTDDNEVNNIVELADIYSVYQYATNELELGNKSNDIINIYRDTLNRIKKLGGIE